MKKSKDNQQNKAILRGEADIDPLEYIVEWNFKLNKPKKKLNGTKEEKIEQAYQLISNKFTKKYLKIRYRAWLMSEHLISKFQKQFTYIL